MGVYRLLGFLFLGLAAVGIFLPLLPTTPFVLVAAACFARSSEKWHRWMLASPTFGPMIRDWEQNRCVSRRVKLIAVLSMLAVGGGSVGFALEDPRWQWAGLALICIGLLVVISLKTCREMSPSSSE